MKQSLKLAVRKRSLPARWPGGLATRQGWCPPPGQQPPTARLVRQAGGAGSQPFSEGWWIPALTDSAGWAEAIPREQTVHLKPPGAARSGRWRMDSERPVLKHGPRSLAVARVVGWQARGRNEGD